MLPPFSVNCCVKIKGRSTHNNLRLLYFGGTLTELSIIIALPKFLNSYLFTGEILTTSDFTSCNEFILG